MTTATSTTFFKKIAFEDTPDFVARFRDDLYNTKLVHFTSVPKDVDHMEFYENLVNQMGEILAVDEDDKSGDANASRWTDIRYVMETNNTTFRHANTRQPLHTDAAYTNFDQDINFFFCIEAAEIGGATTFIDSKPVLEILQKYYKELYTQLCDTEVVFDKGGNQRKKRKIIDTDERGVKFNWNWYRVSDENSAEVKAMCDEFHEFLESRIVMGGLLEPVYLKPGECVFFHDDRILHGRNSFLGSRNLIKGGFNFK